MLAPPPMNTLLALATVQNSMGMPLWSSRVDESEYPSPTPQNSPTCASAPFPFPFPQSQSPQAPQSTASGPERPRGLRVAPTPAVSQARDQASSLSSSSSAEASPSSPTDSVRTVRKKKSSFDLRDEFQHGAREAARTRTRAASAASR
ncbi:hypothetical protein FIBSPDRAFT_873160 [Athelia psychrophila]|uniref:Uncharacterized protein n=1 Tax=Athelia psychrophila TaxID=1759441 RepID=A0A165YU59_9AGAM|nr:hypothetical protein FIBSPDRAFT_873160 [Fibularhizoctonia sp. CBS 109695]